jgi:Icc-related predicted phosphoesterase
MRHPELDLTWWDIIGKAKAKRLVQKSWSKGRKVLEAFNKTGKKTYLVPGNWDWTPNGLPWKYKTYAEMVKGLKNVVDVHMKARVAGDYTIIGYGDHSGPELPQNKKDKKRARDNDVMDLLKQDYRYTKGKLEQLFKKAKKPVIFLTHNVPFGTKLDMVLDKNSPRYKEHFGSVIVKELVKKYKPIVCVGGHMHSPFAKIKISKTVCVNAGYRAITGMSLPGPKFKAYKKADY